MPTKPDFDPELHLSEAKRKEFEDEELARRIQREMEEEENAERERDSSQRSSQEMDDMELARRLQFGEEAEGLEDPMQRHLDDRQRETGISDQMEYARRLQQQALLDVNTTAAAASRDSLSGSNSNEEEDPDLALARRMNEMYEMGMDSCADFETFQALTTGDSQSAAFHTGGSNHEGRQFRSQEEEDAAIARLMAESGESLRHLDLNNLPQPGSSDEASGSRPGAHHVPIPAGYSETMMQASTRPARTPPTGYILDADQVDVPRRPSGARAASREAASAAERSYPPSTAPKRRSLPRSGERLQTLPENGIDPPGVPLPPRVIDAEVVSADAANSKSKSKPRSGGIFGLGVLPKSLNLASERVAPKIPVSSRPPPKRKPGPVPYSVSASRLVDVPAASATPKKKSASRQSRSSKPPTCCVCHQPATHYLSALDKRYHHECFRCMGCHNLIDTTAPFAYMQDEQGDKHPLHRECFSELYGVKCAVCKKTIPAGPDGKVSFVKHPFFDTEQMCPSHAASPGRRCTGCHRFEPEDEPFADLDDVGRVVCYSCCRTAVVDSSDAAPLWRSVIKFFDKKLNLPIWPDMREVPVLIVGYKSLNEQMKQTGGVHGGSSQIMTRGVCLTEHQTSGRKLKATTLKFNERKQSFERRDEHQKGFTFLQVPDANKVNPDSSVTCILCLSGLPRDLTASVLAHEATHAWIKLHPKYDVLNPLDPQIEEGCAQLVAMLYLSEGLPPASGDTDGDGGPSEEKLRQYFKFSIESDNHEIYGEGYRKAAAAYSKIGILALLSHVVMYKEFPNV
jgi:hypothetical protein